VWSPPNHEWRQTLDPHVIAHVYPAREVLPEMLERGDGYLLQSVSASGRPHIPARRHMRHCATSTPDTAQHPPLRSAPEAVADLLVRGIDVVRLLILTPDASVGALAARVDDYDTWLATAAG
jgi:hypothetical protein